MGLILFHVLNNIILKPKTFGELARSESGLTVRDNVNRQDKKGWRLEITLIGKVQKGGLTVRNNVNRKTKSQKRTAMFD